MGTGGCAKAALTIVLAVVVPGLWVAQGASQTDHLSRCVEELASPEPSVRRDAARELGRLGAWEAAGALVPLLADPDEGVRLEARDALEQMGDEALELILGGVQAPEAATREGCADLLGRLSYLEDPRAAHSLLPLLQDPVPEVRKQACLALGRLDDLTVVGALKTSLQDPEPSVRLGAAASLVQLGDGTGFVVLLEGATSPDPRLRLAAIGPLASVATPAAAQVLRDLAADADPGVRQAAHSALLGSGEPSSVRSALLGFEDPDWRARQHLAHIAGVLRVSAAADTLLDRLTHDESASVRVAAGIALANLGDRRAVPQLLTGLESPSEMERCGAANALGILGVKEAATPLTALLEDEAAGVRRAARLALLRILEDCPDCPK